MKKVEVKFLPGDEVSVVPLECKGIVVHTNIARGPVIDYKVKYWLDGKRVEEWFDGEELQ